jgi:hypothetical protein
MEIVKEVPSEGNEVGGGDRINKHDKCCRQLMKSALLHSF